MLPISYGSQKAEAVKKIGQNSHMLFHVLRRSAWYVSLRARPFAPVMVLFPSSILEDYTLLSSAFPSTFSGYKKNASMARKALRIHSMLFSISFNFNMY